MPSRSTNTVIFDMDGCLVDSEPLSLEAIAAEMRSSGLKGTTVQELTDRYLGVSIQQICSDIAARLGRPYPEGIVERMEARLFEVYRTELKVIKGGLSLLYSLQTAGIITGIASGASIRRLEMTLKFSGLAPFFGNRAFSADLVARGKPSPDVFLLAASRLGAAPSECVVLEDSPHGIQGAVAAGMRAVGFVGGSHLDGRREAHADILISAGAEKVIARLDEAYEALLLEDGGRP